MASNSGLLKRGIYDHLAADSAVSALVGDRIYTTYTPQLDTMPFVVFRRTAALRGQTNDGLDGYVEATFDLDCWAETEAEADALGDAVREAICGQGFRAQFGSFNIQHCKHVTERDEAEYGDGKEQPLFGHILTVNIAYQEDQSG
jgi:hypothetical protein